MFRDHFKNIAWCQSIFPALGNWLSCSSHANRFAPATQAATSAVTEPCPAWTAIEVAGFASDGVVVELRVIARRQIK